MWTRRPKSWTSPTSSSDLPVIGQRLTRRGAHFAFTDRWGGVSLAPCGELNLGGAVGDVPESVRVNRSRAAGALGLDPAAVVWMNQVHGRDVAFADTLPDRTGLSGGLTGPADAVVTACRGTVLAVLVADCTPVLLADPVAGIAGAAHCGRPGLAAGVVPAVVEAMRELGARPERIVAVTGPAVCGQCYEVPAAMRDEVAAQAPGSWSETGWGTPALDVPGGVHAQLARLGVGEREKSHICTMESVDHFSYRREGRTGRLAGYVWLEPTASPHDWGEAASDRPTPEGLV